MEMVKTVFEWMIQNYDALLMALNAIIAALISISMLIPGEQPEKALRAIANILEKFSRKPSEKKGDNAKDEVKNT